MGKITNFKDAEVFINKVHFYYQYKKKRILRTKVNLGTNLNLKGGINLKKLFRNVM